MRRIQLGDVGTLFDVTVKNQAGQLVTELESATTLEMVFQRPNGTTYRRTASYLGAGRIGYITQNNDIDAVGRWKGQGYVELSSFRGNTSIFEFQVENVLD